ncbi:MAG TPA: hypothetical protein VF610_06225, partial [Segetibacter sp.]
AGVRQEVINRSFYFSENGKITLGTNIPTSAKVIWLRATWDVDGVAHFYYSINGTDFTPIGKPYQITNFGNFLGAKLGIFTSNDEEESGFVDINWFHYDVK